MQVPFRGWAALALILALAAPAAPAAPAGGTDATVDATAARWQDVSRQIWEFAETALKETKSSALLADVLEKEGFAVTRGAAGMPTAFVATAGSGTPVVAILAEYDALPGLSQKPGEAKKSALVAGAPGHGCGHNLGTAAVGGRRREPRADRAEAAGHDPGPRDARRGADPREDVPAQGRRFGERTSSSPGILRPTATSTAGRLAITAPTSSSFGKTAHAAANPGWAGAPDAVEVFEHAMSLMREHVLPTARLHRVVKDGGLAANIIPDYARAVVRARHERRPRDRDGRPPPEGRGRRGARDGDVREGDGLASDARATLQRDDLASCRRTSSVGAPKWDAADQALAKAIQKEVGIPETGLSAEVLPYAKGRGVSASSDIGEVSAAYPLIELGVETAPSGAPWHHWDVASCAANPIGVKGMLVAAKVLASSAVDLLTDPAAVAAAKAEFTKATGGKPYVCPFPKDAVPKTY